MKRKTERLAEGEPPCGAGNLINPRSASQNSAWPDSAPSNPDSLFHLSENNMASYNETSAKNATNVDTVFEEIIGQATNTTEAIKSEVGAPITNLVVDLNKPSNTSKQAQQDKGCCD